MEAFAQSVGNEKLPSEFDWVVDLNTNDAGPLDSRPALRDRSVGLPDTNEVIRRFNRDTGWLAIAVLCTVVLAALVLGVAALVQERHPKAAFDEISPPENPSSQIEAAAAPPKSLDAFTSEINQRDPQANAGSWISPHWQESGRVTELRLHHASSKSRPRFVDVKLLLIALWHQSLARSENSRTWTLFSSWIVGKSVSPPKRAIEWKF